MSIIYMCPTGTHSSLIAANIHIGKINSNSSVSDILELPNYGEYHNTPGLFLYIGKDKLEKPVYTLGVYHKADIIKRSAQDLLRIFNKENDIVFIDVSKYTPRFTIWCNALLKKEIYPREKIALRLKANIKEIYSEIKQYNNYI